MSEPILGYSATRVRYAHVPGDGWRSRMAWWLRRLAARVDDVPATTMCMAFDSEPEVSADAVGNAVMQGVEVTERLFRDEVAAAAAEQALRNHCPELIEEDS